ncbi:MAG: SprB repeat-containing protein, partial [Cyclobacteriaceae bacterium]
MLTTNSVSVSEPSIVSASGLSTLCNTLNNGQVTVTASGGTGAKQYRIDGGAYQMSNVFTGLTTGIAHAIQVRDINLCESSVVNVFVPAPVIAGTATVTQPTCFGQTGMITVNGSGGGTGVLQYSLDGSIYQASNVFLGLGSGNYTVRVRDINLCVALAASVTVTVPPAISVTRTLVEPSCFGLANGSITITASDGVAPFEYSINNGTNYFTTNVFTGLSSGIYTLRARGANGCESSAQVINLTQPSPVGGTIATLPTFSCFSPGNGGTINLTPSGGTPPFSYSWRDNTTNAVIATTEDASFTLGSLLSNTYTVTITDSRGCIGSRTTPVIIQPAQLVSTAIKTDVTCFGASNGSVNLTVTGGTSPYLY